LRNRARTLHTATGKEELIVGVYVNDLIITGAHAEDIDSFKCEMAARF
jgi:hypothetical protein